MKNPKHPWHLRAIAMVAAFAIVFSVPAGISAAPQPNGNHSTNTPIKHLVVIFQENVSFDHYFATYPIAENPSGQTPFHARPGTPTVNGLLSSGLLNHNPNSVNPFRLGPENAVTCDQDHDYGDEQKAFDAGLMDKFPESVGQGSSTAFPCNDLGLGNGIVMGYYDGNTVTGLWNYAQHFAMSDNSFSTQFGPSTVGAVNLISANTAGATLVPTTGAGTPASAAGNISNGANTGSVIGDPRPAFDDCVVTNTGLVGKTTITMTGTNIGDLLNAKNISWGWFAGGFAPTGQDAQGRAICGSTGSGLAGNDGVTTNGDYLPHHEPFMYYEQSNNQHHLRPSSIAAIGSTDQARHQYDLEDFWTAVKHGNMPAVSFLKARSFQDGHAAYSDPIDEQFFIVNTINALEATPEWRETAVIILYDDSDGWYDHAIGPIVNQANVSDDNLVAPGSCGQARPVPDTGDLQNGRCGYGPRQPLLIVSGFAKRNFVDHNVTDQASVIRFIEDNWGLGRLGNGSADAIAGSLLNMLDFGQSGWHRVFLDPHTGRVVGEID